MLVGRVLSVATASVLAGLMLATPAAHAALPSADLVALPASGHGKLGTTIAITLITRNYGPNYVTTATHDIVAPGGTEFADEFSSSARCKFIVPKRHLRCFAGGWLVWKGQYQNPWTLKFKIVSATVTPGWHRISFADDPKSSNNTASIKVTVDGLPKPSPSKTTPRPSAKPSPIRAASASASVSPSPVATESVAPVESSSEAAPIMAEPEVTSDSGMSTGGLIVGGIAILLGVALLAGVLLRGRNRTLAEEQGEAAARPSWWFQQNGGS